MNISAIILGLLLVQQVPGDHSGRSGQINIVVPRLEAGAEIDGVLDEPAWGQAARLTDFSQYQPVDGRPAEDPTEVLVWYSPEAIHFGIRATEMHGDIVRATQANRDNIASEDHVSILLDTYNDRRVAFLFSVNALGVQADGTRSDQFGGGAGGSSATGGGTGNINPMDGSVDLNPDYNFFSKGRLVDGGYVVEVRIPFKSLRYQEGSVQDWGIHVLRRVQHSGFQDSWAPAVRANASFLAQAGTLSGLQDMKRGLVLEITPSSTARFDGDRADDGSWGYSSGGSLSGDVRWGIRENATLTGTINPDFSQVEADVGQVVLNERFALFYPEKRAFFLDGLELFDTPSQLIYTRRIVDPEAGLKLGGKVGRLNVATILAAESRDYSESGDDTPVFAIARLRSDIGRSSTVGGVLTTREDGGSYSRLAGADLRIVHSKLYFAQFQAVQSWTEAGGAPSNGPLLSAVWDRTGRNWGFNYSVTAIAPDFEAAAGFVNRTGTFATRAFNRLTGYGRKDALIETYGAFFGISRLWSYDDISGGTIEGDESIFPSATLRGGWRLSGSLSRSFFSFEPDAYLNYTVETDPAMDPVAFTVPPKETDLWTGSVGATSPTYQYLTATASFGFGETPIFREAAPGRRRSIRATVDVRPTNSLRATLQFVRRTLTRARDDSRFSTENIPRLKVEYQITPSIFVRFIGQYTARTRSALVDRSGDAIFVENVRDTGDTSNEFRTDWLFSYRPTPGTLVYFGYGATMDEPGERRFRELSRTADGFFAKVSYLFRI
ncbi:MAG: carbohydrate binding family 9 domain-containing protein [Rhodothermales bacterium]|nr:carbohydrate binding family 9 domain-containing protein [Rhodothermales bacterium]